MTAPSERQPPARRGEEVPQFSLIERICHGAEIVQMADGRRRYHVTYERGTFEAPQPSHYFFDSVAQVLNNHERVIQRNLGLLVQLPEGTSLLIPGEAQRMSELSGKLTTLVGKQVALVTYDESSSLKGEIASCLSELGNVTNVYKVAAKQDLEVAYVETSAAGQLDAILSSALRITQRDTEALRIAQGTLGRWRIVFAKRDEEVERPIVRRYEDLGKELKRLNGGNLTEREREQVARHISGNEGLLTQLNRITWPEYWRRIQDRDIQRLSDFGAHVRAGNDTIAVRILEHAISKLWRVAEERVKRERGEREK